MLGHNLQREHDTGGTPVRVKYFWNFDMELALEIICFPIPSRYNTRERKQCFVRPAPAIMGAASTLPPVRVKYFWDFS